MSIQPPPMPPSIIFPDQAKIDDDHLRILSVFHFVFAGFAVLGLFFIAAHFAIMHSVFGNPELWNNQPGSNPPPEGFFDAFRWMYLFMALVIIAGGVMNYLSGVYLRKKKHRTFSMIVAGVNCMNMPLGTALGVFTLIVLLRDSVSRAYGAGD